MKMLLMTKFKIGDVVSVLDEEISGIVTKVSNTLITITTEDDFEFDFNAKDLVHINPKTEFSQSIFSKSALDDVVKSKEQETKRNVPKVKPKERSRPNLVVDLHIHKLTDSTKGMSNFDMLTLQLDTVKQQLEFAIRKRIQKVVFIHGVGAGVLRMELETLLRRYDNLKFYDADFKTYGFGATEVYIYQNAKA